MRITPRDRERYGATAELTIDDLFGFNDIRIGAWTENDKTNENREFYRVNNARTGIAYSPDNLNYIAYERDVETDTTSFYIQDKISLLDDRIGIDIGFTWHDIEYNYGSPIEFAGRNVISAETDGVDIKFSGLYRLTENVEAFVAYSENFAGIFEDVFLGSSDAINPNTIQPESSENIDVGLRWITDTAALSFQWYQIDFDNRLTVVPVSQSLANIPGIINGNAATQASNLGGIDSTGFELTAAYRGETFDAYATYSYQEAEWQDDDLAQGIIRGERVQDIPENSFYGELGWMPNQNFRLSLNARHVGDRVGANLFVPGFCNPFFCFDEAGNGVNGGEILEIQEIPDYWLVGLLASYDIPDVASLQNVRIQLNVDNLLDEEFISAVTGATAQVAEFGVIGGLTATSAIDRYFIGYPRTVTFSVVVDF